MELSIIIVNWKSCAYLEACLDSVYRHPPQSPFEIIVIDNASFDGSGEMLADRFPSVTFVQSKVNLGFSGANNLAARQSKGQWLLFLNPDTEVHAGAIDALRRSLERDPSAACAGAKLLNSDGTIQTSCIQRFPTLLNQALDAEILQRAFPSWSLWGQKPLRDRGVLPVRVDAISGACILIRREVFDTLGGFDEGYFMYSEDVDLSFRIKKAGHSTLFVSTAVVTHHGGCSSGEQPATAFASVTMRESKRRFFEQYRGRLYAALYRFEMGLVGALRCAILLFGLMAPPATRRQTVAMSIRKWAAIVRWSVGLENPGQRLTSETS